MNNKIDLAKLPLRHSFNEIFNLEDGRMVYRVEDNSWLITLTDDEERYIWEELPKDFLNSYKWNIQVYNETKGIYVYLKEFDLNVFSKTSRNKLSPNRLKFDLEYFRDNYRGYNFETMFQNDDRIKFTVKLDSGFERTIFQGRVKSEKRVYKNRRHKISVEVYDDTKKGYYSNFTKSTILENHYVCNSGSKETSLLHQLAYQLGFSDEELVFENVTNKNFESIIIPYTFFEKGENIMSELSDLALAFSGDLFIGNDLKLHFKVIHKDTGGTSYTLDEYILQKELEIEKKIVNYNSSKVVYDTYIQETEQVIFKLKGKNGTDTDAKILIPVGTDTSSDTWWGISYISGFVVGINPSFTTSGYYYNDLGNRVNIKPLIENTHYEIVYDSGGGKIKFLNPTGFDFFIENFQIRGNPVYKFSGNEYQITKNGIEEVDRKTIEIKAKYIQSKEQAKEKCEQLYIKNCLENKQIKATLNLAFNLEPVTKVLVDHHDFNGTIILEDIKHKKGVTTIQAYEFKDYIFTDETLDELESGTIDTTIESVASDTKSLEQRVYEIENGGDSSHVHSNYSTLNKLGESNGTLLFDGNPIEGGGGGGSVIDVDTVYQVGTLAELETLTQNADLGLPRASNTRVIIEWTGTGKTILDKAYDIPFDNVRFISINGGNFEIPLDFTGDYAFKFGVDCEFIAELSFPFSKIRYIRDEMAGSDSNPGNHWVEIQAYDIGGTNMALNKYVYNYFDPNENSVSEKGNGNKDCGKVVDGNTSSTYYAEPLTGGGKNLILDSYVVDLGELKKIQKIKIWHYYSDKRTYYGKKTWISEDGVTWLKIYDEIENGTYAESSSGKEHFLINLDMRKDWIISNSVAPVSVTVEVNYSQNFIEWDDINQCVNFNIVPTNQSVDLGGANITYDTQEEGIKINFN